jgi:hypothetical protein
LKQPLKSANRRSRTRRAKLQKSIDAYKAAHGCSGCGESDPVVLDFDHRDSSIKKTNIASMVSDRYSLEIIKKEIAKCDILCANCHRRKTFREGDHLRRRGPKKSLPSPQLPLFD